MTTRLVPEALAPSPEAQHNPNGLGGLLALVDGRPVALPLRVVTVRARLVRNDMQRLRPATTMSKDPGVPRRGSPLIKVCY